jgi:hypothetical protein
MVADASKQSPNGFPEDPGQAPTEYENEGGGEDVRKSGDEALPHRRE